MIVRVFLGALASAVILMAWGFVFWTVIAPRQQLVGSPPNEKGILAAINEGNVSTGCYFIPGMPEGENPALTETQWRQQRAAGPIVQLFVRRPGIDPQNPRTYAWGFAQFFVSGLIAAILLAASHGARGPYLGRVLFVVALGLFMVVTADLARGIWFHHPAHWVLWNAAYVAIGWLLVSLALAGIVREKVGGG